ncbi:MAG: hypothetical protein ACTSQJ_10160, partial [Promethearchaeota archaeon]
SFIEKYFSRIFTVLSEDIKYKILKLEISEKEKQEIKKELAFLPKYQQKKYLEELSTLMNFLLKSKNKGR